MWFVEFLVVLGFIFLGARLGSIGMGFAGGLGVLTLALVFGVEPGRIPVEVILIVMGVISTIATMQVAGGLDYMVRIASKILQNNPKRITFLAPAVTYGLTLLADNLFQVWPWMLAVILFLAAMLLYSQAATTTALMPAAIALGISPLWAIAAFPAVNALFVPPTYPTLLAAMEFDDTGSTRIGNYLFDHPFFLPVKVTDLQGKLERIGVLRAKRGQ